jgi:hypothetical protein
MWICDKQCAQRQSFCCCCSWSLNRFEPTRVYAHRTSMAKHSFNCGVHIALLIMKPYAFGVQLRAQMDWIERITKTNGPLFKESSWRTDWTRFSCVNRLECRLDSTMDKEYRFSFLESGSHRPKGRNLHDTRKTVRTGITSLKQWTCLIHGSKGPGAARSKHEKHSPLSDIQIIL